MNKKLLLVSLLSVGMLVGCGNTGDNTSSVVPSSETPTSSEVPATSETPATSEDGGDTEWTGKYGNAGYYLVGEPNGWDSFWKFSGFEDFLFTPSKTDENIYTLKISFTEEFLASDAIAEDDPTGVDFKVMYWDGNKAPSEWWPGETKNNGVISEAGEYLLTFNKASTETAEKTDGSGTYTKYTSWERIGDARAETTFAKGDARQFESTYGKVTYRVKVEEGLTLPEGSSIYVHVWGLETQEKDEKGNVVKLDGDYEMTKGSNGIWSFTTEKPVVTDDGTGVGMHYGFCIIVDEAGKTLVDENGKSLVDWNKKVANSASTDGNYAIDVTTTQTSSTAVLLKKADQPWWLKGTVDAPYTVAEAVAFMTSNKYVADSEFYVQGVVESATYQSKFNSWNINLVVPVAEGEKATYTFQLYSAVLGEGLLEPQAGDTVVATGKSTIYEKEGKLPVYELAYAQSHGVNPQITDVIRMSEYYMRGSFDASWNALSTHQFRVTGENVAELTVTLAEGTKFKVATADWSKEANATHLVVDKSVAEGTFTGESDIKCTVAGTYTFVLDLSGEAPVLTVKLAA